MLQFVCVKKNSIVDAVACMKDKSHQFLASGCQVCGAKKNWWVRVQLTGQGQTNQAGHQQGDAHEGDE